ncbi:MAG: ABC transporter ATP-binding protein/permease [Desulfobacterales bacterium]|nr:ABC transporter ATP-binding protein/permease [Desulfobacterales bacterium]
MKHFFDILIRFTRDFLVFSRWRAAGLLLVSVLTGMTQGIGFFMLIPLFSLFEVGPPRSQSPESWPAALFHYLHIPPTFASLLLVFFMLMTLAALLRYKQTTMTQHIQRTYISRLQSRLFSGLIHAEWEFISNRKASNLTHVITGDLPVVATGTFSFLQILSNSALALCYIFWAANISVLMTCIVLATVGMTFSLFRAYFSKSLDTGQVMRKARSGVFTVLMDHISGVKIAKSYGAENREQKKFKEIVNRISEESIRITRLNAGLNIWFNILSSLVLCLMLYIALVILSIPLADTAIIILLFSRLIPVLSTLQNAFQRLAAMLPSFAAAEDLYLRAQACRELAGNSQDPPPDLKSELRLNKVSFRHKTEKNGFCIRNLSLKIPAFKTTAVCGPSGTGKSTLADLISGILQPDTGAIIADGVRLTPRNLRAWRKSVGYVPQEVFLFHDTIRNNILWGNPDATDEEISAALKAASANRFVNLLPDGLDTIVKDRGSRLSGGERQMIALARTLVRNPGLLILDEATSSMDKKNEAAVFDSLSGLRGKMTILFISHGQETLAHADQVIRLPGETG